MDAALALGEVEYEPLGAGPDLRLTLESGEVVWIEANWLTEAYLEQKNLMEACDRAIWAEAERRGISPNKIRTEHAGEATLKGVNPALPQEHRLREVTKHCRVQSFFSAVLEAPADGAVCDLKPDGYSLKLHYDPNSPDGVFSSGGIVPEAPLRSKYHPVYKALRGKAKQSKKAFSAAGVEGSVVVCLAGRRVSSLRESVSPSVTKPSEAVAKAFRENTTLAGALLCTFGDKRRGVVDGTELVAERDFFASPHAAFPLSPEARSTLLKLDLNRWTYRFVGAEDEGPLPIRVHQERRGGKIEFADVGGGRRFRVSENLFLALLSGQANEGDARWLRDRLAPSLASDRRVISVKLIAAEPRSGEPAYLEFEFGPATPPVY